MNTNSNAINVSGGKEIIIKNNTILDNRGASKSLDRGYYDTRGNNLGPIYIIGNYISGVTYTEIDRTYKPYIKDNINVSSNLTWFGQVEGRPSASDRFYRGEFMISTATGAGSSTYVPLKNAAGNYIWVQVTATTG